MTKEGLSVKRIAGWLLALVIIFSFSAASAQKVTCYIGGFSVKLPDSFVEGSFENADPDLCFYWHGKRLTVQAYCAYQGEIGISDLFVVLTGNETEDRYVTIHGMDMRCIRSEDGSDISVMYTWMDRGNNVSLYFYYAADDPTVQEYVDSIMNSISFDIGY